MARLELKRTLGDGGGGQDLSHGSTDLRTLLVSMMKLMHFMSAWVVGTIATGILNKRVVREANVLRELVVSVDVAGSAGATTVQVRLNGVSQGSITVDNTAADPSQSVLKLGTGGNGIDVKAGDVVAINVSAAPTGGTGLSVEVRAWPADIEA